MKICLKLILTNKDEIKEKQFGETAWSFIPRCIHYISSKFSQADADKLIQIIDKISRQPNPKLDIIVKYFKRDDLDCLIDNGWVVTDVDIVLPSAELYKFIEDSGFKGVTLEDMRNKWPHIKTSNMPITNLQYAGKISTGSGPKSDHAKYEIEHTYIIKEHLGANRTYWANIRQGHKAPIIVEEQDSFKPSKLTKAKQRECRKSIINKASVTDFNKYGFTEKFMSSLSDDEKSYIMSLDDFKTKLLFNAIAKSCSLTAS
jgi:hypothetical protein